uniref:ATP-dependent DNA helicase n=1 Tax=Aegilops tauschii subsp. strangulata TaxID=200361 RepID=A0A453JKF9_AEGTS
VEKSMLTEYFEANRLHEDARSILYRDFPEWYTWQTTERRGLIEGDNTLDESLTESTLYEMPSSLRRLFATILVFCEPSDVRGLWEKHLDAMSEDYRRSNPSKVAVEQLVLIDIRNMLQSMGKEIESFPLPDIQEEYDTSIGVTREIFEESTIELNVEDTYLSDSLNSDQRAAYDEIMSAIDRDEGGVFFVDGPGSRAQIINSSLRRSYLWDSMRHLKLVRNMRAHSDPWFAEYLLHIGDGKEETNRDGEVAFQTRYVCQELGRTLTLIH